MATQATLYMIFLGTLLICTIIGLMVYKRISPLYKPMVIFSWVCFVLHLIDTFFLPADNYIMKHIFPLAELAIICWQAKRWNVFERRPAMLWGIIVFAIALWSIENLTRTNTTAGISWFGVAAYMIIAIIGIEILTRTMTYGEGRLLRNARFLFSVGLTMFYMLSGLLDLFMLIGQYSGKGLLYTVFYFSMALGIFTHIIYLRSFLCIPSKSNYSIS